MFLKNYIKDNVKKSLSPIKRRNEDELALQYIKSYKNKEIKAYSDPRIHNTETREISYKKGVNLLINLGFKLVKKRVDYSEKYWGK